jgi:Spy/CpxP family protein refolding chaperone
MKSNAIVVLLLCIVASSQPAFTGVQRKPTDDEPPHVTVARSSDDLVLVAMPFSSLQLSPSLVEYLGLTPTQVRSVQRLMDRERPITEPLMHELRTISGELRVASQRSHNNENEGTPRRLAARQARLLTQLMMANSRLQRRINDVLDPQQRKKFDSFKHTSEVTVVEGN